MSNKSVSIRSPLSCVRGLHANRCPRLMLTSCSWLAAIKSINENINTDFSASLSPYVRAAQGPRFPRGLCEWTGCSEPARSGSPSLFTEQRVHRLGDAGGETHHVCVPSRNPALPAKAWIKAGSISAPWTDKCGSAEPLNTAPLHRTSPCSLWYRLAALSRIQLP